MTLLALALLLPTPLQEPDAPPPARLTVDGGYAEDRPLVPGTRIHVWAHQDPTVEVFLGWEGPAAEHLDARDSWHAVLTVPVGGLPEPRLHARLERLELEPRSLSFTGPTREKTLDFLAPADGPARALAFYFHDSGARRGTLKKGETWNTALVLVRHGYAVAAFNSEEADDDRPGEDGQMRWNGKEADPEANLDLQNLIAARAALVAAGTVSEDAPSFAFGQGNGGTFALSAAAALAWQAGASFAGPGRLALLQTQAAPSMWVLGTKDTVLRSAAEQARECRRMLEEKGVPTSILFSGTSPLRLERLVERLGMDPIVAETTLATMRETGVLNADGYLQMPGLTAASRLEMEKIAYEDLHIWCAEDLSRVTEMKIQFEAINGGHALMADYALRMLAFFEEHRGG